MADLEASTFQKRPCYRYIRESDKLPALDSTDRISPHDDGAPMARIKLFDPTSNWTWYIAEYDPETRRAFGRVHGFEDEYGYIDMKEIVDQRGRFGLPIERDLYWTRRPLSECS